MKNIFIVLFLLITASSFSTTIRSTGNGDWETAATWDLNREPTDNDTIVIEAGHTVELGNRIELDGVYIEIEGELYLYDGPGAANSTQGRLVIDDASEIYILDNGSVTAEDASAAYALIERTGGTATTYWDSNDGDLTGPATIDATDGLTYTLPTDYTPLPIELISFTATQDNNSIHLAWETATEENNDFFTIERSANGIYFEIIEYELGAGNSSVSLNYTIIDNPQYEGIYYYKLKQTDYNGDFSYSDIISISYTSASELSKVNIYYGNHAVNVNLNNAYSNIKVSLYDVSGMKLLTKQYSYVSEFSLPVNGNFNIVFAVVEYGNGKKETKKLYIGN